MYTMWIYINITFIPEGIVIVPDTVYILQLIILQNLCSQSENNDKYQVRLQVLPTDINL